MNGYDERLPEIHSAADLHRATVCLWSDSIDEKVDFTAWLTAWRKRMTFVSHDYGCGWRIHLFDLEGPKEAIDALPQGLLMISAWTEHGIKQVPRSKPSSAATVEGRGG
jgi:hypothetical protein